MDYKKTILIPAGDFEYYEKFLKNGVSIPGAYSDEMVAAYGCKFSDGMEMDIRIYNAPDVEGGAWIDSVLYAPEIESGAFCEVGVVLAGNTLDTSYVLEYNGNTYTVILTKGEPSDET